MTAPRLPDPLVPPDVDLRGYEYMPYYGDRLRESGLNARVTDAEYRAAHNLWWSAWKQVPAASLPDDDVDLCKAADLGRDQKTWQAVKAGAMRGFVLCSDGRWYHRALSEFALDAWALRTTARANGKLGAAKRWEGHRQQKAVATPPIGDSGGNGPAIENDSKEGKGKERKGFGGDSTISTRVDTGQGRLKTALKSKPIGDSTDDRSVDDRRELAKKLVSGEIKVGP